MRGPGARTEAEIRKAVKRSKSQIVLFHIKVTRSELFRFILRTVTSGRSNEQGRVQPVNLDVNLILAATNISRYLSVFDTSIQNNVAIVMTSACICLKPQRKLRNSLVKLNEDYNSLFRTDSH
jgi:hypothetical protein